MPESKPTYKVNPAIIDDSVKKACDEAAVLIRKALRVLSPVSSYQGTITIDYGMYDTMCCVLGAIREKYAEWQNADTSVKADEIVDEISDLLKKAGY